MCLKELPDGAALSPRAAAAENAHVLAFLGDSVYSLLVREMIVKEGNMKAGAMHQRSITLVNAAAQAAGYEKIRELLTETEAAVFRRARNAHSTHTPKHMTEGEYHAATGVEAVFGYLYLTGETARIRYLFGAITDHT
ncbi:MAG: ribonuclease III [Clostridia bacterium]|nr:ribonuclease III [Clostridia bacterium]